MAKLVRYKGGAVEAPTIRRTQQAALSEEARGFQQIASSLDRMSNFLYSRGMTEKVKKEEEIKKQLQENVTYQVGELIKERGPREVLEMKGPGLPENYVEREQERIASKLLIIDVKAQTQKNAKFLYDEALANDLPLQEFNSSIDSLSSAYLSEYGKYMNNEVYLQARTELAASLEQYKTDYNTHIQGKILKQKEKEILEYVSGLRADVRSMANDPFTYDQQIIDRKINDIEEAYITMRYSAEKIEAEKTEIYNEALYGRITAQYNGITSYSGKVKFVENLDKDPTVIEAFTRPQINSLKNSLLKENDEQIKIINAKKTDITKKLKSSIEIVNNNGSFSESGIQALASQVNMLIENADGLPVDLTEMVDLYDDLVFFNTLTVQTKSKSPEQIGASIQQIKEIGLPGKGDDGELDTDIEVKVVKFLTKRKNAAETQLEKNSYNYAIQTGALEYVPLNLDDPVNFIPQKRLDQMDTLKSKYYNYDIKLFTDEEARGIGEAYKTHTVENKIKLVTAIVKNSGQYAQIAIDQISAENPELASMASMALTIEGGPGNALLRDALVGMERVKADSKYGLSSWDSGIASNLFDQFFVSAFQGQNADQLAQYRKISEFIYKEKFAGEDTFDENAYKHVLNGMTGNRLSEVRGEIVYSENYKANALSTMLDAITTENLEDMGNSNFSKDFAERIRRSDEIKIMTQNNGQSYNIYYVVDGVKTYLKTKDGKFLKFVPDEFTEEIRPKVLRKDDVLSDIPVSP